MSAIIDVLGSWFFWLAIVIIAAYALYFSIALDEMKRKSRIKRIIWLVLIPACFPTSLLAFLILGYGFSALIVAFEVSVVAWVILVLLGEAFDVIDGYLDRICGAPS